MLSEISHTEKDEYCRSHLLYLESKKVKHTEPESRTVVARSGGEGNGDVMSIVYKLSVII